jgi:hypothetical protein
MAHIMRDLRHRANLLSSLSSAGQTVAGSPTLRLFPIFGPPFLLHCLAHLHIPSISRGTIPGYWTIRKASVDGIYLATMVHTSALARIDAGTV